MIKKTVIYFRRWSAKRALGKLNKSGSRLVNNAAKKRYTNALGKYNKALQDIT